MPGWTKERALHLTVVLLYVERFQTLITDSSLYSEQRCTKYRSATLLSQIMQLLLKSLIYQDTQKLYEQEFMGILKL